LRRFDQSNAVSGKRRVCFRIVRVLGQVCAICPWIRFQPCVHYLFELLQESAVGLLAVKIEEYLSRRASFHATVGDAA
jgi:hypothetical protein